MEGSSPRWLPFFRKISEDTAMRSSDCRPMQCAPSLSASRALLRGAKKRTADRSQVSGLAHVKLWKKGEKPILVQRVLEGSADLCI